MLKNNQNGVINSKCQISVIIHYDRGWKISFCGNSNMLIYYYYFGLHRVILMVHTVDDTKIPIKKPNLIFLSLCMCTLYDTNRHYHYLSFKCQCVNSNCVHAVCCILTRKQKISMKLGSRCIRTVTVVPN